MGANPEAIILFPLTQQKGDKNPSKDMQERPGIKNFIFDCDLLKYLEHVCKSKFLCIRISIYTFKAFL